MALDPGGFDSLADCVQTECSPPQIPTFLELRGPVGTEMIEPSAGHTDMRMTSHPCVSTVLPYFSHLAVDSHLESDGLV